ncbi:MAG: hypothetical protein ACK5MY_11690 [Jhaorihella sp.]
MHRPPAPHGASAPFLHRLFRVAALAALMLPWTGPGLLTAPPAAASGVVEQQTDKLKDSGSAARFGFRSGSFILAPIPFKSPLIGSGLALGGAYLFRNDAESDTSNIALGAFRTSNGSTGFGLLGKLAFSDNRWQSQMFVGRAELNYDVFTPLGPVPIRQRGDLFSLKLAYGFTPDFSIGPTLRYLDSGIAPAAGLLPPQIAPDINLKLVTLGLALDWDTRDDSDYPTRGARATLEALGGRSVNGFRRDYAMAYANYDAFVSLSRSTVLASRVSVCGASASAPFFEKCAPGLNDNFRGFPATQYLDRRSASVQFEIRQRLGRRFGAVAFAGLGQAGPSFGALDRNGTLGAAGVGARFRLSREFPVDFSVDMSWNSNDDRLTYIYVGQRW